MTRAKLTEEREEAACELALEIAIERAWLWLTSNARVQAKPLHLTPRRKITTAGGIVVPVGSLLIGTYTSTVTLQQLRDDVFATHQELVGPA